MYATRKTDYSRKRVFYSYAKVNQFYFDIYRNEKTFYKSKKFQKPTIVR